MKEHAQEIGTVVKGQRVDPQKGLNKTEVQQRLEQYGKNKLVAKEKIHPLTIFFSQFRSFIIYILLFAVIISFIAGEYVDAIVILIILLFNAIFGFIQEYKAERAIEALKKLSGLKAQVIREGKQKEIDAEELVPGDILLLEAGSKVPADGRIIEAHGLVVSEASLTGESVPVAKHAKKLPQQKALAQMKNLVFSGTTITKGKAKVVVLRTGMKTEMGNIAGMVSETKDELTPLQRNLESLGKWVGLATIIICCLVFLVGIIREDHITLLLNGEFVAFIFAAKTWFLTAISLAVAAVPEGLPIIVTIALAIGTRKMLARNALIRKLPSVETLGETNIICTDKTGTLTTNKMTVRNVFVNNEEITFSGEGYDMKGTPSRKITENEMILFKAGILCNDATLDKEKDSYVARGDPTEIAFLVSARKAGLNYEKVRNTHRLLDEIPFDSERKCMSVITKENETKKEYVYTKGAPEKILEKCNKILRNGKVVSLDAKEKKKILTKNDAFAEQALRVLGFAYKPYRKGTAIEKDLIFIGLQAMIDPPHKRVREAIERCRTAGIRVVMMTGDNLNTAKAIGREVGLKGGAMLGSDFDTLTDTQKQNAIKKTTIFARVEPDHKLEIVRLYQESGAIVAMTGDGVNDAPAVKHANLGIAMGIAGSDVTKESSEMILQDDNFVSIVDAVEEGRGIYTNIRKFVNYLFSSNIAEILIIFFAILLGWDLPLTAIMLLWINLVTDGLPALALSVDPSPKGLMKQPPRKSNEGIMTRTMTIAIMYVSILIAASVLYLFYTALPHGLIHAQSIAFTALIVMELVRLQTIRTESGVRILSNKYLIMALLVSLGLQLAVLYTPLGTLFGVVSLGLTDWMKIIGVSLIVLVLNMIGQKILRKTFEKK